MTAKSTSILIEQESSPRQKTSTLSSDSVDIGVLRPWRLALLVVRDQVELIVNLNAECTLGRVDARNSQQPDIDLRPFEAEKLGVSRLHLTLKLEGDRVVAVDNKSSNGTRLNGAALKPGQSYLVQHSDKLTLGALEIQVEMLINPLD